MLPGGEAAETLAAARPPRSGARPAWGSAGRGRAEHRGGRPHPAGPARAQAVETNGGFMAWPRAVTSVPFEHVVGLPLEVGVSRLGAARR